MNHTAKLVNYGLSLVSKTQKNWSEYLSTTNASQSPKYAVIYVESLLNHGKGVYSTSMKLFPQVPSFN